MKRILIAVCMAFVASSALFAKTSNVVPSSSDLFAAVESGNCKAVKNLLKKGAPVNELNAEGKTVLDMVVEQGDLKMSRDIISYHGRVTSDRNAMTLKDYFKARAGRFFVFGWFFMPWLWFGSVASLNKASKVMVLVK